VQDRAHQVQTAVRLVDEGAPGSVELVAQWCSQCCAVSLQITGFQHLPTQASRLVGSDLCGVEQLWSDDAEGVQHQSSQVSGLVQRLVHIAAEQHPRLLPVVEGDAHFVD
jgi:hypothetical protein